MGFNAYMSALYGVNRAFKEEATKLLRDYVVVITLMLEQSCTQEEIQYTHVETTALMVISLTKSYVLSVRVLGYIYPRADHRPRPRGRLIDPLGHQGSRSRRGTMSV